MKRFLAHLKLITSHVLLMLDVYVFRHKWYWLCDKNAIMDMEASEILGYRYYCSKCRKEI